MKWNEKSVAAATGIGCLVLFTGLLIADRIGPGFYAILVAFTMIVSIAISALPRLQELTLKLGQKTPHPPYALAESNFLSAYDSYGKHPSC